MGKERLGETLGRVLSPRGVFGPKEILILFPCIWTFTTIDTAVFRNHPLPTKVVIALSAFCVD